MKAWLGICLITLGAAAAAAEGCSTPSRDSSFEEKKKKASGTDDSLSFGDDDTTFAEGGLPGPTETADPITCEEASKAKTYVGCDYWPTITPNVVKDSLDFAVVIANGGKTEASVTVTGPNGLSKSATVASNALEKITLPWSTLKSASTSSITTGGAFHLVSSIPVTVYQFSPLQYAKNSEFSYTNDASLLLPSTAMTGTYRVMGYRSTQTSPTFMAITGTEADTNVIVKLSATATILGGSGVMATSGGGSLRATLNAGDVLLLQASASSSYDVSGSLVTADKPVQTLTGSRCTNIPDNATACDHTEESVMPAETLGKHYVVTRPSGPNITPVAHVVRFYGNVDGTALTYLPYQPPGCPKTLKAGQIADCGAVDGDFEVSGDHEFGVEMFQQGSSVIDPGTDPAKGDPAQSTAVAVEQFRTKYVFLAPDDYDINFADVIVPTGTKLKLDGKDVTAKAPAVSTNYGVVRLALSAKNGGSHTLTGDKPVGLQVIGYGSYTSYQYPGGLNLDRIAVAPVN